MKRFGLIGYPLDHSHSARWWNTRFTERGMSDCRYDNFEREDIANLYELLASYPDLVGLNVTIPHKERIVPLLDDLDETAAAIGAVNTVVVTESGTIGYNTDAEGFRKSIRPFLESTHDRALVLGTGGASRAVVHALKALGITCFRVSRRPGGGELTYEDLTPEVYRSCHLIVNCTPVGMHGHSQHAPISCEHLTPSHFVVDLIYNPAETALLRGARNRGALTLNGDDMLRFQAEAAWRLFGLGE